VAFASPEALVLLLAIPVLVAIGVLMRRKGGAIVVPGILPFRGAPSSARARFAPLLVVLRCLALALVVVALARPQTGGVPVVDSANAVDVVLALDVSSSMGSEDFPPLNRLDIARRVISDFVDGRPGDRIGLVAFARYSVLKCPLTIDHDLLKFQLEGVRMATGDDDGTAIGMALANAVRHLRRSPARSRVVVLLTDGENNRSTIDPATGAELARALGVRVYAIGVGRSAAAAADAPGGAGHGFNEKALRDIADATGGKYFRADDVATLSAVFGEIDALERSPVPTPSYLWRREWFTIPALAAAVVAACELLLRHTSLRRLP
jgi:Ca-activated chloride channel family protein